MTSTPMRKMFSARADIVKNSRFAKTAAVCAVAVFSAFLCGCSLFRAPGGVGREDVTSQEQTSAADSTSSAVTDTDARTSGDTTPPAPVTTEPAPVEKRASVLAVGDNIIHEAVFTDAKNRAADGAEYDFVPMYSGVAERIAGADIAFVNHETPLAGKEYGISGYPTFNAPREAGQALVDVGFDVINLANNHILDKRVAGARATAEYVQSLPVTEIGVYLDQADADTLRVTEVNGIRIAWLSFCYGSNNPYDPAKDDIIMPLLDDDAAITSAIRRAGQSADLVIVSAHWGVEYQNTPSAEQKRLAALMAEAGADVILGHHPHVIQPVDWHENADGSRTLVAYSLGNFLSTQHYATNMVGGMLTFDVVLEPSGTCRIEEPVFRPTVTHYSMNRDGLQIYMLEDYTEALAAGHGCKLYTTDFSLAWIDRYVTSVIDRSFLPAHFDS